MSNDDLTFVQRCALIILTLENREVANVELEKVLRLALKKDQRDFLKDKHKCITVRQERKGGPVWMTITDAGKNRAIAELGSPVPTGAGAGGAALYRILATLKTFLDSTGTAPATFFGMKIAEPAADVVVRTADDLETLIRKAYGVVAKRSGDFVMLSRLRPRLGDVARDEVDAALKRLNRAPDVSLVPESNQKGLTEEDRDAAVIIGNQDRHLISIGL